MKLNQLIALSNGKKSKLKSEMTAVYQSFSKTERFNGLEKNYQRLDEEGQELPPESKIVQLTVDEQIQEIEDIFTDTIDLVASQDRTNQEARADVKIEGEVLLQDVPVTSLIFLEKQLENLRAFVSAIPTLSPSDVWSRDENSGKYISDEVITHRIEKRQVPVVLYPATDHHPAQTELITKDELAGHWHTRKISGAIPETKQREMLVKVEKLKSAVISAREEANSIDATQMEIGNKVFNYIFK